MTGREWLTVAEAAEAMSLHSSAVYRLCSSGDLLHRKIGPARGRIQVSRAGLDSYLKSCEVGGEGGMRPPNPRSVRASRPRPRVSGPRLGMDGEPIPPDFVLTFRGRKKA